MFLLFYFKMLFSGLYLKPAEEKAMLDILVVKCYKCSHFMDICNYNAGKDPIKRPHFWNKMEF